MKLFEDWLKNKDLKERTISNYIYYFNKFTYQKFNQESISHFLSNKTNRNSICRSFIVNFKKFILVNNKALNINDEYYKEISEVELPKITGRVKEKLINPLSQEQILTLEKNLHTEQLKLMLLLSYYGGLRLGELISIKIFSFNWANWKNDMEKMGEVKVFGKGDKEGIAIIPKSIMKRIAQFIKVNNFKSVDSKLFKIGARSWQQQLHNAGINSGITHKEEGGEVIKDTAVHPHKLRHSYAHNLLISGVDIRYIKEALRHSSISSTQIYTQLTKEELKNKLDIVNK